MESSLNRISVMSWSLFVCELFDLWSVVVCPDVYLITSRMRTLKFEEDSCRSIITFRLS